MLGKKMSNSSSTKGRSNIQNTSSSMPRSSSKNSLSSSINHVSSPGSPGSPPIIAHIKGQDNFKLLPRYSEALSRPHDDSMPAEDLDSIQLELELLLSTVAQRARGLKYEFDSLDREPEVVAAMKRDKKTAKSIDKPSPASPGKRKRGAAGIGGSGGISVGGSNGAGSGIGGGGIGGSSSSGLGPSEEKKFKENIKFFGGGKQKMSKLKIGSSHSPVQLVHDDLPKVILPKNDTPNKFWLSVEPYCMPITQEDIKLLDDLIEEYSGPLVPPIPELGPHYSTQWANEDLKDEQDNSNQNVKSNKRFTANIGNSDVSNMIKKGEKLLGENITGPLTQRLMSVFLEENLISPDSLDIDTAGSNAGGGGGGGGVGIGTGSSTAATGGGGIDAAAINRTMTMLKNGISIERRVKKELIEHGLLDPEDFSKENEDEILAEIMRVRTELSAVAEHNYTELQKLHTAAKEEMKRLEIKRKLDAVDQEIIEMYKKVVAIKSECGKLTDQEREEVFRLTNEQKRLSDQLETTPAPGSEQYSHF